MSVGVVQETFTHRDTDGTVRAFSIPMLRESILTQNHLWRRQTMPVERAQAEFIRRNQGVEEARIKAYPLAKLDEPGIALIFADSSMLIVDGNHRYVKRFRRGLKSMDFWMTDEAVWTHALVDRGDLSRIR